MWYLKSEKEHRRLFANFIHRLYSHSYCRWLLLKLLLLFLFKQDCAFRVTAAHFEVHTMNALKVLVSEYSSNPQFLWVDVSTNKVIANRWLDHCFQLTAYTIVLCQTIKLPAILESIHRKQTSNKTDHTCWCQWLSHTESHLGASPMQFMPNNTLWTIKNVVHLWSQLWSYNHNILPPFYGSQCSGISHTQGTFAMLKKVKYKFPDPEPDISSPKSNWLVFV